MLKTFKIAISGQVQGVGFRPYVYTLATTFLLKGTVSNNEEGVIIFVTGESANINLFYKKLIDLPPPVSKINHHNSKEIDHVEFKEFSIIKSNKGGQLNLPLTPDFGICKDCKEDIQNPKNKRHNYPFTTCVNCGPRWAITQTFPFERVHTSINEFNMCESCLEEYTNPLDRRFHSQTNTCSKCGVKLKLLNNVGEEIVVDYGSLFKKIANLLLEGKIIAIKNTSGYLLCCNAEDKEAITRLRKLKNRPKKPFGILYPSLEKLKSEILLSDSQVNALTSSERPITIVSLNNYKGKIVIESIAPGLNQLGVMLPYTGILQLLVNQLHFPIVATSGNIHGSPIISEENEALNKLKNLADYFLQHNLKITHPQDDSVLKFSFKHNLSCLFRRSRGYAPNYLNIKVSSKEKLLALGADIKSSIAFLPNEHLYVSQYLGNLENYDTYDRFTNETKTFTDIFEQIPEVILVDKHPKYFSSQFGAELSKLWKTKYIEIQHHKAHFAAVLGEHDLFNTNQNILGVVWDGTGYGDDGNIWGGEFFNYSNGQIDRIAHFEYYNWLSGDKMSKEPRLSLLSLLNDNEILEQKFSNEELSIYDKIKGNNKLKTSSLGRVFDAVASLLNICDYNSYEGEAAILLENRVIEYNLDACKNYCEKFEDNISGRKILEAIKQDYLQGVPIEKIIANFLFTLASIIFQVANKNNIKTICCSGGVFQNTTLMDMLKDIGSDQYKLYFNCNLAPNDENVSFGQIMYYLNCIN